MKKSKISKKLLRKIKPKHRKYFIFGLILLFATLAFSYSNCVDVKFSTGPKIKPLECPSGQVVSGNVCIPATCDTSGVNLTEQNACPSPQMGLRTRTRTVSCEADTAVPGPWGEWDYSACVCPVGSGQVLNPSTGTCSCPAGQTPNGSGICGTPTCNLSGISLDESKPCPSGLGLAWRHRTAHCDGSNPVADSWGPWDYSTCGCPVDSGQNPNANGTCVCPAGQTFNSSQGKCVGDTCGPVSTPLACPAVSGAASFGSGVTTCNVCTVGGDPQAPTGCAQNYDGCTYDAGYCANSGNWISRIGINYPPSFNTVDTGTTVHSSQRCPCPTGQVDIQGHCGVCPTGQTYDATNHVCGPCTTCMAPVTFTLSCSASNNNSNTCSTNISSWMPTGVQSSALKITGGSIIRWFNHGNDWPHTNTSQDVSVRIVGTSLQMTVNQVRADVSVTIAAGPLYSGNVIWYAGQLHDPWCEKNNYLLGTPEVPDAPIGSHYGTSEARCDGIPGPTPYTCIPNVGDHSAYSLWMGDITCEPPSGGGDTQL